MAEFAATDGADAYASASTANIFTHRAQRPDPKSSRTCSTSTERRRRDSCIANECGGDNSSNCARRCRYVHCLEEEDLVGRGCDTVKKRTCKVDCFEERRCDSNKKSGREVEECKMKCRKECCGGDSDDDNNGGGDDKKREKKEEEAKREGDQKKQQEEQEEDAAPSTINKKQADASDGGTTSGSGSTSGRDSEASEKDASSIEESVPASSATDPAPAGGTSEEVVVAEDRSDALMEGESEAQAAASAASAASSNADDEWGEVTPSSKEQMATAATATSTTTTTTETTSDTSSADPEPVPVSFRFNIPVSDDVTAEQILSGEGNTILQDVEGGLGVMLPELIETTFGGSSGGGQQQQQQQRKRGRKRHRGLRHIRHRSLLVTYDDMDPPSITNVESAACASEEQSGCFDFDAEATLYVADENIASVRENFVRGTYDAIQDGKLSDAILEYNPSYEYGRSAEVLTAAPVQAAGDTDSGGDGSGGLDTTAIIIIAVSIFGGLLLLLLCLGIFRKCGSGNSAAEAAKTSKRETTVTDSDERSPSPQDRDESDGDNETKPPPPKKPAAKPRANNICSTPLEIDPDFVPPVHPKTEDESMLIRQALQGNFVFENLAPAELMTLVKAFEKHTVPAGSDVITQGDMGDYFYIIQEGTVDFIVNDNHVGSAGASKSFGELALLYNSPRAATCRASSECMLWRVDQKTFRMILASTALSGSNGVRDILLKISFLKELAPADLSRVVDALTEKEYKAGEDFFVRGDEGDAFYVVKSGRVKVHDILVGNTRYDDVILDEGNYFGERAIVTSETRAASVTAIDDTVALVLTRDDFIRMLGDVSKLILKAADKRKLRALPVFSKARVREYEFNAMAGQLVDMSFEKGGQLSVAGSEVDPCIVFVREGKLEVTEENGSTNELTEGGYFGEETIRSENYGYYVVATKDIVALEDSTVGILLLSDIADILGSIDRLDGICDTLDASITLEDLDKHRILGVGTFGQVWLCSRKGAIAKDDVYALKIQVKRELLNHQQVEGVKREKEVMSNIDHPFIIKLINTFQDDRQVYMLLQLVQGGELYSILHTEGRDGVSENATLFYSAAILEGLAHMHRRNILYRDLKPENVLIDSSGYPVIVDLGFAKIVEDKTFTLCGTTVYIAPELILSRGHDKAADYWSWGVLLYELIIGKTPFDEDGLNQMGIFKKIVKGTFSYPRPKMGVITAGQPSADLKDLINQVLVVRAAHRLGSLAGGDKDIRNHHFYRRLDWKHLLKKGYTAPWIPDISDPLDSHHFDDWQHMEKNDDDKGKVPNEVEQAEFRDF